MSQALFYILKRKKAHPRLSLPSFNHPITASVWLSLPTLPKKKKKKTGGVSQWLQALVYKLNDLSLILGTHMKEKKIALKNYPLTSTCVHTHIYTRIHTHTKLITKKTLK